MYAPSSRLAAFLSTALMAGSHAFSPIPMATYARHAVGCRGISMQAPAPPSQVLLDLLTLFDEGQPHLPIVCQTRRTLKMFFISTHILCPRFLSVLSSFFSLLHS